jgi:hypothetical protein
VRYFIAATLVLVGIIHLLPLVGVLGSPRLSELYGISVTEQNTEILMRHRAALFGLLGGFFIFAAFNPPFQVVGFIAGIVSVASFLLLAFSVGQYNTQLSRVVVADILALFLLVSGGLALVLSNRVA